MKAFKQWFMPDQKVSGLATGARKELAQLFYAKARINRRIEEERAAWARKAYEADESGSAAHEIAVRKLESHRQNLAHAIVQTKQVLELAEQERRDLADEKLLRKVQPAGFDTRQEELEHRRLQRLAEAELESELILVG